LHHRCHRRGKGGHTLPRGRRPCIHWVRCGKERWIERQRSAGWRIVVGAGASLNVAVAGSLVLYRLAGMA
jgi:hypothetical protein